MLFHLFTKQEGKKPASQDQQKRSLNWFLFFWLGFISVQYLLKQLRVGSLIIESTYSTGSLTQSSITFIPVKGPLMNTTNILISVFPFIVFTLLMVLHGGLHWFALIRKIRKNNPLYLKFYFPLQLICIWLIYLMSDGGRGGGDVLVGLCLMLAIEAIILLKRVALIIATAAGCLLFCFALQELNLLTLAQQDLPVLPKLIGVFTESSALIPFVCASVMLYIQQTRAHQRDQELLRELETAHIQLEDYAARVQDLTLTAERQRIARELHDTLAQGLVGLTMQLETIDSLLIKQRCEQARTIVQQAMTRSRATIASARAAITDLRREFPTTDIQTAVEAEAEHFTAATGIPCTCSLHISPPDEYHEPVVRMVSEVLSNIARHAQASQAWIRSYIDNEAIIFEIGDNGIGFEPAKVTTGHYGLLGLRERARLVKGHVQITSEPYQGTTVRFGLPYREKG